MAKKITAERLANKSAKATVAVLVDGQNVNGIKYNQDILNFVASLGDPSFLWFYHHWIQIRSPRLKKVKVDGWKIINVTEKGKNALDYQAIQEFREHCESSGMPDILVIVTCDKDFLPLIKDYLKAGRKVFVIGRRNHISKKLIAWVGNNFCWVEDLHLLNSSS